MRFVHNLFHKSTNNTQPRLSGVQIYIKAAQQTRTRRTQNLPISILPRFCSQIDHNILLLTTPPSHKVHSKKQKNSTYHNDFSKIVLISRSEIIKKQNIQNMATSYPELKRPKNKILTVIKEYLIMTIGMCIYSFGWIGCVLPAKSTSGAASGLAIVVSTALQNTMGWEVKIGTIVLIINVVLLIIAGFLLGWNFGIKTIYCIFALSMSMNIWQDILPADDFLHIDRFLSMVIGGVVTGFGVAIAIMQGGSAGGTDIVAMIINKFRSISYGRIIFILDLLIIASSLTVGFSIDAAIYGYIMTLVFGYTVDMILAGNKQSSQVFIISPKYDDITHALTTELGRGVTLIEGEGGYTHNKTKMVMVVCSNRETPAVMKYVKDIDPNAFITVASVMGVYGQGFQPIKL